MNLNYSLNKEDTNIEPEESKKVEYPFKSERKMDGLRNMIDMQQTVNKVLAKNSEDDNFKENKENNLETLAGNRVWGKQ